MKKHKRKEFSLPILLLMGAGFALCTVIAVSLILSIVAYLTSDPTAMIGAFALLSLALAGAISGFVTSRVNGEGGVLVGVLSAMICAAVMLAVGIVCKGGLLPLSAVLNIAVLVATSSFSALLGKGKHKRRR